jgi:hypothetical protein
MAEAYVTVVGTHFRSSEAKTIVNALAIGDTGFTFEAEPDNEYDPNAVKVFVSSEHIGYLSRQNNSQLAQLAQSGAALSASVIDFEGRKPVLHVTWPD